MEIGRVFLPNVTRGYAREILTPTVVLDAFVSASSAQDDLHDAADHDHRLKPAIRRLRT